MAALSGRHDPDQFATAMRNTPWRDAAATAARQPGLASARPPSPGLFTDVPAPAPEPPGPLQAPTPGQDARRRRPVRAAHSRHCAGPGSEHREIIGLPPRNFNGRRPQLARLGEPDQRPRKACAIG